MLGGAWLVAGRIDPKNGLEGWQWTHSLLSFIAHSTSSRPSATMQLSAKQVTLRGAFATSRPSKRVLRCKVGINM